MKLREEAWTQAPLLDSPKAIRAFPSVYSLIGYADATHPRTWYPGKKFRYESYDGEEFTVVRNEGGLITTVEGPVFDYRSSGRRSR